MEGVSVEVGSGVNVGVSALVGVFVGDAISVMLGEGIGGVVAISCVGAPLGVQPINRIPATNKMKTRRDIYLLLCIVSSINKPGLLLSA